MKFEVTDKATYTTVIMSVEDENGNDFRVTITEHDWYDDYHVEDWGGEEIEEGTELYDALVAFCDTELAK